MNERRLSSSPVWRRDTAAVDRRSVLAGLAGGLAASAVEAQGDGRCVLTPDAGEGPFYFDPELVRADITDGAAGAPLELTLSVVRADDCATLERARVDVWQADGLGLYSGYDRQPGVGGGISTDVAGQTFLRGTQFSDADGRVRFRTIYPSWYGGRTPHVHFKIFVSEREVVASQVFFPEDINREVFASWEPYRRHQQRRVGFNDNDPFLNGNVDGVFGTVTRAADGFAADVVVAIAAG
jgi:protocatechuate 3,4-dioxygenase beta subunit